MVVGVAVTLGVGGVGCVCVGGRYGWWASAGFRLCMSGGVIGGALWVAWVGDLGGGVGWGLVY